MKKTIITFLLFVSVATMVSSCKKESKKSEKEKNIELLVSGKWYYNSFNTRTCFTANHYWEFKSDGTFTETWDFGNGNGTYTLSEDGKTLVLKLAGSTSTYNVSITSINTSNLIFNLMFDDGSSTVTLSKTVGTCNK